MKTITKNYTVYNYNELSDSAKEKVKQWYLDDPFRCECFTEYIKDNLNNLFPNSALEVQYSLANCQGDGVNIYGDLSVTDLLDKLIGKVSNKEFRKAKIYLEEVQLFKLPVNYRYCYCITDRYDFEGDIITALENVYFRDIDENFIKKISDIFRDILTSLCREYEEQGYNYLYEIEEEEMQEVCDINDYEFLQDGTLF